MLPGPLAEIVAVVLLAVVLGFALVRPHELPELLAAAPAAGLALLLGLTTPASAGRQLVELGPTVAFLAAILLLGHLAAVEGVFAWLGGQLASHSRGSPRLLLQLTFAAAAITTAVLSLDATVVLLTPVVLATAQSLRVRARPHVYACAHLANSASLLLPVSNLTNLLAFSRSGLSFTGFALLMAGPWLVVIAVEYLVLRVWFRADLRLEPDGDAAGFEPVPTDAGAAGERADQDVDLSPAPPRFALVVLAVTLAGFGVSSLLGLEPVWVALLGAVVLGARSLLTGRIRLTGLVRAADPQFCLFVLALGVVVQAVAEHGLGTALATNLPTAPTLGGLLVVAAVAAVLSNVLNNIPATLLLLAALGDTPHPGLVLAVLIGVNIGPNLTYIGSLATLLWRRVLDGTSAAPTVREFSVVGALTVPPCLVGAVVVMWAALPLVS